MITRQIYCLLIYCLLVRPMFADDRTAADFLPDTVAVYVELPSGESILKHPVRERLFASEVVKELLRTPDALKLRGGITIAESVLGNTLENLASQLTARGVSIAIDADTNGAMLLAHSENKLALSEFVAKVQTLSQKNQDTEKSVEPMRKLEYRGFDVYERDKIAYAAVEDWLLVTNKGPLGKIAIDRYLDRKPGSLAEYKAFQLALLGRRSGGPKESAPTSILWSWLNLQIFREKGLANKLAKGFSQNPIAELIAGGLMATVDKSPYVCGTLEASDRTVQFKVTSPHIPQWVGPSREFFFGPSGQGRAAPLVGLPDSLLSVSAYRDISAMWVRAGDLFSEEVNGQMAQADSSLATLFSGRSFGEDILGSIKPEFRIVVKQQIFGPAVPRPAIQLPSFALVAELREPLTMQRELKRIFQSLVGFINVAGATNGQPQLDLDSEKTKSGSLVMATYVPEVDRKSNSEAPIQFNFSPCLAFEGNYAVLSSSVDLARELAKFLENHAASPDSSVALQYNTELEVHAEAIREALNANRRQLVAQNMLEKGHSKEQAEGEVQILLRLLELLQSARLTLDANTELTLNMGIELK